MQGSTKPQSTVQVDPTFLQNFEELANDPITSPLEAWTELNPPANHMEQPIPGGLPPGGGYSSGAGAGDTIEDHSQQETQSQQSNYQIPLSILDVPGLDNVTVGNPYGVGSINQNSVYNPLEATGFSDNWQAVADLGWLFEPPASSSQEDSLSPLGENEQEVNSNNSSSHPPSYDPKASQRWRDWFVDSSGKRVYTRSPHTYYRQKHSRDICHVVANRSHNGGKGASRGTIVSMIRAYYYCKGG